MRHRLPKPTFDVDMLLTELRLIDDDNRPNDDRLQLDHMKTPEEAVYQKCAVPEGNFVDTWKMNWSDAKILKTLMPELSLYWTDRYTATDGRIIIADAYEALDCEDLVFLINEINSQSWSGVQRYKYQDKPRRLRISRNLIESFYKVPVQSSWLGY
ncbi:MAG: hypothetical protein EOP45_09330 [Sphingobacteriaceae bacterium]|nr:MAG: hypothetical protein EOP45_09330 [Sphingobacteriaceae bacterium]